MALKAKSMFLYNFEITELNSSIDFRASSGGPILMATLRLGSYSLTSLLLEIARAMGVADPDNGYTPTANRNVAGGLENRVSIATDGSYLDLLFGSGPRLASSVGTLIGFQPIDYTGALSYTGSASSGIVLIPTMVGYNYLDPDLNTKNFGAVNLSAAGNKESVTWQLQKFVQVQFKYEPILKVKTEWFEFFNWAIQQKLFEFTPEIATPGIFYEVTLEKTSADGKGLGQKFNEMIPKFPNLYDTGPLMFRVNNP